MFPSRKSSSPRPAGPVREPEQAVGGGTFISHPQSAKRLLRVLGVEPRKVLSPIFSLLG
jgi:hypothetical protein